MLTALRRAARLTVPAIAAFGITAAGVPETLAQAPRRWVDPPADLPAGAGPGPAAPPSQAAPAETPPGPVDPPAPTAQPRQAPAEAGPAVRSAQPDREAPAPAPPPASSPQPLPSSRSAQPQPPASAAPPARAESPAASPRPPQSAERGRAAGDRRGRLASREEAARDLVSDYLDLWSAPNPLTLAGSAEFYAPNVIFHGRAMSARALLEEKRRFVQRWPERRYRARKDTIGVACGPSGETCTVRSVFDFLAVDPERGRRSQGVATLELVVSFSEDDRPLITAENSLVHGRTRGGGPALEDAPDAP